MPKYRVAMLVGSNRKASLNVRLARAIEKSAPSSIQFTWVPMYDMPFYNADLEDNRPTPVNQFVAAIEAADAVCMVTPEYNRSIPAVLKNAIDWGSKPPENNVWRDKVIAMAGTSPGSLGTALAQQHLRQMLPILGSIILPGEVYITFKDSNMIEDDGTVNDPDVADFIADFCQRFARFIQRLDH
ncbi:NAD(P)H-dependent oxidoreductase [Aestuariicella hydrocarbonica]|uniref:NAD(P)H-dependent oxidoreductase n=1 Tax=Pseudomaricurvus hydrocarbonicus TaxID=1470433 RepID=A0A9E5MKS7_9GAMM|nr:NAD(P)H-dependent oxidoreductase [Aestuariicella hydrocarbonica]NHO66969.1 NAD(P)H-dependent oxidoreductase [Aestuariicella hydrocarbonica]